VPQTTLTAATALAHERLYPRVAALLKQVERAAARHPGHPVPEATRAVAKPLFAEARKILGREAMRGLSGGAVDSAALGVALERLVAALQAFEAEHSAWSAKAKCAVWRVEGPAMPVARLRPAGAIAAPAIPQAKDDPAFRSKLFRRICERENLRYLQGYRDGKAGRDPIPPIKDIEIIPES
jgi:hypothetical protein